MTLQLLRQVDGKPAHTIAPKHRADDVNAHRFANRALELPAIPTGSAVAEGGRHSLIQTGADQGVKAVSPAPFEIGLGFGVGLRIAGAFGGVDDVVFVRRTGFAPTGVGLHKIEDGVHGLETVVSLGVCLVEDGLQFGDLAGGKTWAQPERTSYF